MGARIRSLPHTMQMLARLRLPGALPSNFARPLSAAATAAKSDTKAAPTKAPISRWQRLKAERRAAPPPKHRVPTTGAPAPALPEGDVGLSEALAYVQEASWASFDESVELAVVLGIDTRIAAQNIRTHAILPHGHGVRRRVAILDGGDFSSDDETYVVGEDLLDKVVETKGRSLKGVAVAIAPAISAGEVTARVGRFLGPKGLLPNSKEGTVVRDVEAAAEKAAKRWVRLRADRAGNVHAVVGKVSMDAKQLEENVFEVMKRIMAARPVSVKRGYLKRATVCSTMGKGVRLNIQQLAREARLFESLSETM